MKKYVKPELILEHYELSHTIADCGWELNQQTEQSCIAYPDEKLTFPGITLFSEIPRCYMLAEDLEGYCYHNGPEGYFNLFRS